MLTVAHKGHWTELAYRGWLPWGLSNTRSLSLQQPPFFLGGITPLLLQGCNMIFAMNVADLHTARSEKHLYIFLDEGGGFDFSPSGTKYFTLTSLTTRRSFPWDLTFPPLKYDLIEEGLDLEYFHASEDRQKVRDQVFSLIEDCLDTTRIDSLIVEKRKTAPALQPLVKFYPRMLGYLLQYVFQGVDSSQYEEVVVLTDRLPVKKKRQAVEKAIKTTLSNILPATVNYRVLHHESRSCIGLQVVDYCNWAIYRKWTKSDPRSYNRIKSSIRSEFDIFKSGQTYYY